MPANPQHEWALSFIDYDKEIATMGGFMGPITAGTLPGFLTQFGALKTATNAIVLGAMSKDRWSGDVTNFDPTAPTDENAQRERKGLVRYKDNVSFAVYRLEIPTIDPVGRLLAGTDLFDLANADIAAWITAFQAMARSPEGGAVTVLDIRLVGRST